MRTRCSPCVLAGLVAAVVLPTAPAAAERCALARYRVEGTLAERGSGRPVEGARVYLFLDDDASPWRDAPRRVPDHARSDEDGRFESAVLFAPDAPPEARAPARCDSRPRELEVVVAKDGAFTLRQRYAIDALERAGTRQDPVLRLPPILLERPVAAPAPAG
jgi:hypothetical protein